MYKHSRKFLGYLITKVFFAWLFPFFKHISESKANNEIENEPIECCEWKCWTNIFFVKHRYVKLKKNKLLYSTYIILKKKINRAYTPIIFFYPWYPWYILMPSTHPKIVLRTRNLPKKAVLYDETSVYTNIFWKFSAREKLIIVCFRSCSI